MAAAVAIQPFADAVEKLDRRTPIGAALSTEEWADVPLALRERAQFSAWVESARFLGRVQDKLQRHVGMVREAVAKGEAFVDRSSFVRDMKQLAADYGVATTDEKGAGTLRDIRSARRLRLIFDMQVKSAHGYARHKMGQDPDVLDAWPAQELIRREQRQVPRDWDARWTGPRPAGRKVALKTDPIWSDISRFDVPWAPFDFQSGMGVRAIDREEAEGLGLVTRGERVQPNLEEFNADLEAGAAGLGPDMRQALANVFGDQIDIDGDRVRWRGGRTS